MKKWGTVLIVILWLLGTVVYASDMSSADFIIKSPSMGTGGGYGSSASFTMFSAGNANVSGTGGTSASFQAKAGFLQYPQVASGVLSGGVSGSTINLTWTASTASNGYTVSGYNVGISTTSGSGYAFTSAGNVTSYSYTNQLPGTYYLVIQTLDAFNNVIATSNEVTEVVQETVSFSISNNSVSFGTLSLSGPRYATTGGGSGTLTSAHTISAASNSSSGYTVYYKGATLASGANTISPATITGSSSGTAGSNQFALALLAAGSASVPTSYDESSSNWSFAQNTLSTIATTSGPTAVANLNAYYLANAGSSAQAGSYSTVLTYEMTANY
jgi:hypothetical protein